MKIVTTNKILLGMITSLVSCSIAEPLIGPKAEKKHTQPDNTSTANTSTTPTNDSTPGSAADIPPIPNLSIEDLIEKVGASSFVADNAAITKPEDIANAINNHKPAYLAGTPEQTSFYKSWINLAYGDHIEVFAPNNSSYPWTYECSKVIDFETGGSEWLNIWHNWAEGVDINTAITTSLPPSIYANIHTTKENGDDVQMGINAVGAMVVTIVSSEYKCAVYREKLIETSACVGRYGFNYYQKIDLTEGHYVKTTRKTVFVNSIYDGKISESVGGTEVTLTQTPGTTDQATTVTTPTYSIILGGIPLSEYKPRPIITHHIKVSPDTCTFVP